MALQSREWKKVQLKQEKERNKKYCALFIVGARRPAASDWFGVGNTSFATLTGGCSAKMKHNNYWGHDVQCGNPAGRQLFFSCDKNIIFTATENVGIMPWSETISRNRQHTDFKGSSSSVKSARIDVKFPLNWCQLCCPHDQIKIYK